MNRQPKFSTAFEAHEYAVEKNCKLSLANEKILSENLHYALSYSIHISGKLNIRSKLIEKAFSKDAYYSYRYSQDVLKSRFKLGEKIIAQSSQYSYLYAKIILKSRFKLGEKAIINDTTWNSIPNSSPCYLLYIYNILEKNVPLDFLQLCPINLLETLSPEDVQNYDDVIKVLFKKKLLSND